MTNINLTTSYESDIFIDVELQIIKSNGLKLSRVDFINYLLEEISKDDKISKILRDKLLLKIICVKKKRDLKIKKIQSGVL